VALSSTDLLAGTGARGQLERRLKRLLTYLGRHPDLNARVRGQQGAVEAVVSRLELRAVGWTDAGRPRGAYLLLGGAGVGKSWLAECLAEEVQRDSGAVFTLSLAGFQGTGGGAEARFRGAPPSFVGHKETVTVYSHVLARPRSVVVFDDVDQASPALAGPLAEVLGGRSADAQNRVVDFSQCVFCLTAAAGDLPAGTPDPLARARLLGRGEVWQPALLNRLHDVVVLSPLSDDVLLAILGDLVAAWGRTATRQLPTSLQDEQTRQAIVARARAGRPEASAHDLKRALESWLQEAARLPRDPGKDNPHAC
jgi:ATP-dependent Clp protease ATP-binding subunit ClpA